LKNLFKNEKIELRKILSFRDDRGDTIFSEFKNNRYASETLEIFVKLFRETFGENEEEEFQKEIEALQIKNDSVNLDYDY
jgi:hypothetical protein